MGETAMPREGDETPLIGGAKNSARHAVFFA